jgi:hypothetical protein
VPEDLTFFDCNAAIGNWMVPPACGAYHVSTLLEEMDRVGIARALVWHALGKEYDPPVGNELLLKELQGYPRLVPCWTLLPHYTGEMPPPRLLIPAMRESGVRAVRLWPVLHRFSLEAWNCGELLEGLAQARIPVFLEMDQTNFDQVARLLAAYPSLPLVLTRVTYRFGRHLYALWERFDNLYVEISYFQGNDAIVDVTRRFGAGRLLFGTGLPHYAAGGPMAMVMLTELAPQEKQAIASKNLEGLLAQVV